MTTMITIPSTLVELEDALTGLHRLLVAKQWERAAIVYAWTEPQQGGATRFGENPPNQRMSLTAFAALGITGLRDKGQVREYRAAWESAAAEVGNDEMLAVQPGDAIELPDLPWKDHFGEATEDVQERVARAAIAKNPEIVREAAKAIPAVAATVTDIVASSDALFDEAQERVFERRTGAPRGERVTPAMRERPRNRDSEMAEAIYLVNGLLRDERNGDWTPDGISEAMLRLLGNALADRHAKAEPDIFDQIDAYLTSTKTGGAL